MAEKPETRITEACIDWIKKNGGDAFHVHGSMFQRKGEPDICGELPTADGKSWMHLKVEVKTDTGAPETLQMFRLTRYVMRGYCAGIVTSVAELKALVEEFEAFGTSLKSWEETEKKYT